MFARDQNIINKKSSSLYQYNRPKLYILRFKMVEKCVFVVLNKYFIEKMFERIPENMKKIQVQIFLKSIC